MKECPECGGMFANLGAHMRKHKPKEADDGLQEERPLQKWRRQTPIITDGQVGIRYPRRGVKHVGS